jgi:hypothetical protein
MDFDDRKYLIETGGSAVASFAPEALYDIECYSEAMEAFLAASAGERNLRIRAMHNRTPSEVGDYLSRPDNNLLWEDYFPSELRASVLVSLMAFFERYLNGICTEAAVLLRKPIKHTQIRGSAIERAEIFLTSLCAFSSPRRESWESVKTLQGIRNIVVHNGGTFEAAEDLNRARNLVKSLDGATCSEFGLDFESSFVRAALNQVTAFLEEMRAAFSNVCEDVKRFEREA